VEYGLSFIPPLAKTTTTLTAPAIANESGTKGIPWSEQLNPKSENFISNGKGGGEGGGSGNDVEFDAGVEGIAGFP
jgi:hypothetical protein